MKLFRMLTAMVLFVVLSASADANIADFSQGKSYTEGFIPFYYDDESGKVYLEISEFNQEFLFQSSLPHGVGSNDLGLDRGQLGDTRLVQFERVGKKVLLRQKNTYFRANTDNVLEQQAIDEAFASSVIWGFDVVASGDNKVVVDYTPFLLSDIHGISSKLKARKEGNFSIDKSRSAPYLSRTKAFADNTELEAIVTYKGTGAGKYLRSVTPENTAFTVNLHHSLIRLPDNNYQTREFHPFSGFWSVEYADYASAIDQPIKKRVIPRHRLIKKNPDAAVSEAVEPIIYYLDAGVPEPVRSALLDGARWWNQAFEAIGYKNAYQVKMLPADADPMDVRYNVIQWVHRATRGWSYGASVIDPRTGEIIKGHVTLGSLRVRQDYLIALGLTSPFVSDDVDTSAMKNMALARIRQLSAHEVGHTLGIAHNFSASVNNRASVMDYPHPLVTINDQGNIDLNNAYDDKIGTWDKYVVAYGYGDYRGQNETQILQTLVSNAQQQGLEYISDPDARPRSGSHPTAHLWDNGTNPADELLRVLKVRQLALSKLGINSVAHGTPLSELEQVLVPIYNFHRYQVEAAVKLIAGQQYHYEVKTAAKPSGVVAVAADKQQKALMALLQTLDADTLAIPSQVSSLIPPKAYGYYRDRESLDSNMGLSFDPLTAAQASAKFSLDLLLNKERLTRLNWQHASNADIISVRELLNRLLSKTLKAKARSNSLLVIQQRVNQQVVDSLLALYTNAALVTEVRADLYRVLSETKVWLAEQTSGRKADRNPLFAHYRLLAEQITHALNKGDMVKPVNEAKMPPGSPIGS